LLKTKTVIKFGNNKFPSKYTHADDILETGCYQTRAKNLHTSAFEGR